ncbi:arylsulfatase [Cribrihabitans marinus]|nr:arylsulfatase [Cribrihabitans marinus]
MPPPTPIFGGQIETNAAGSKTWWAPRVVPPESAPNVLLIMTDDSGFGVPSTFGGVVPYPTMDALAQDGIAFTNIHSTALCSPTRAALITGRNHHNVGFGVISEQATGFPGYNSIITKDKATVGRVLRDNGFSTSWFGKNHNTPSFAASQSGPFDQWPTGLGFEYFYGFVGGDANQWQPNLYRNTTPIYPFRDQPGWNLVTGMADDAIGWITQMNQINPSKPFFVKYAPGATHAPHHPTPEWIEKIEAMGLFDDGWNALQDQIFANQKNLGLFPDDLQMNPWPSDTIKDWQQLSDDEKKLFIRQVEVFAAYSAYSDHEIGRIIQALKDIGEYDNTLIIYINGDNGTSAEGGLLGTPNEVAFFNGVTEIPVEKQLELYDEWGSEHTYNHMSAGWSWAFDTPFPWFKQNASQLGGIKQNMVVSWPNGISDKGTRRDQFLHVIDVMPTILDVVGVDAPQTVDGIPQAPLDGESFAYLFDAENAKADPPRDTQYFEMMGQWALWQDGWFLATEVNRAPWVSNASPNPDPLNNQVFELYNLTTDPAQANNIAKDHPDRVRDMRQTFIREAAKYQVFPMDASFTTRLAQPRPNITAGRKEFVYTRPMTGLPQGDSPSILNTSYTITAEIEVPEGGAEGMILTSGGRFTGYGFYLLDSKPVFLWNMLDLNRVKWQGSEALPAGKHTIEFDFEYEGLGGQTLAYNSMSGLGQAGTGTLKVNGETVDSKKLDKTIPVILQWDEAFDIGSDTLTGVNDDDYKPPFALTAKLDKLTIAVDPPKLSDADRKRLEDAMKRASD